MKNKLLSVEEQYALVPAILSVPNGTQVVAIISPRLTLNQ